MMKLIDVVNKLVGPIDPVGETRTDDARFENLKTMIELMEGLHKQIDATATYNKDRFEYSMNRAGKRANEYLDWLDYQRIITKGE